MIHYNVWFSFQPTVDEAVQLNRVRSLLEDFRSRQMISGYTLLENRAETGKTKMPKFQVIIEFRNDEQFALPFDEVRQLGIHLGSHGAMIEHVDEFVVEVFQQI
jgi:hypothetical protein